MSQNRSEDFEHHPDHQHHMFLYDSHEEQFDSLAPFVQDGITAGDKILYIAYANSEQDVVNGLQKHGVDIELALRTGAIDIQSAADVYLKNGSFDPTQMVNSLKEELERVREEGYTNLRVTGETGWAIEHDVEIPKLREYEQQVDSVVEDSSIIGVCQYKRSDCPPDLISTLLQTHPRLLDEAKSQTNCYYNLPGGYGQGKSSTETIDQKLATIAEQNRLTTSLSERERHLNLLGQYTDQLKEVDPDKIEEIASNIIAEIVDPALIFFWEYDQDTGELRARGNKNGIKQRTPESILKDLGQQAWDAFIEDSEQEVEIPGSPPINGLLLPVCNHGILFVGTPELNPFNESDVAFLKSVCSHTGAALDQLAHERELEAKNRELSEKNSDLEQVNQINTVIRNVSQSLIEATDENEIVQKVCDLLAQKTDADFIWYGTYDATVKSLHPTQEAGDGRGYLTALSVDDEWEMKEPAGSAARNREIEVLDSIFDDQPLSHWQEQALKRGYQSVISLPVSFDGSLYGVLSLYLDTPNGLTEETIEILDELCDLVAHSINSIRRKEALVTEVATELKFRVTETDIDVMEFVDQNNAKVEVNEVVSADEGGFRLFATFSDTCPEEIRDFGMTSPSISKLEIISEGEGSYRCECKITEHSILSQFLNHNGVPKSVQIEKGEANLVVRLPQETDDREFIEMVDSKYPNAEFVGRQRRKQSLRQLTDIESQIESDLTSRQLEILKLAYHSGYFDRPRKRTVEDLAESLDVSHPTVSRHLREAERKIFSLIIGN